MKRTSHILRNSSESGMALVLVLLIVTLITAMVVEFAYGVYVSTNALHNWQASQKLSFGAKSATRLAAKLISYSGITSGSPQDPLSQDLYTKGILQLSQKIPYGDLDGTITLRIEDENAKFNLNSLRNRDDYPYESFRRLLKQLNLKLEIADMVSFWIYADTKHRPAGAADLQSRDAKLDSVDELLLVPGIDKESYAKLLPYVTIYGSGEGLFSININTADIPVLMSLSDAITKDMAERVVTYRQLTPFSQVSDIFRVSGFTMDTIKTQYLTRNGAAFHVFATAESNGIKRVVESVLEGNAVRYWKEM
jgi:general secretion pathway protein K